MKKPFFIVITLGLLISACAKDNAEQGLCNVEPHEASFKRAVLPIMETKCAVSGCHDETTAAGQINLSNYDGISSEAINARFLSVIKHDEGFLQMPLGGNQLDQTDIDKIECWILRGRPDDE